MYQKSPDHWPNLVLSLVKTARKKFENHLWYLSERLVAFLIFSDSISISEKQHLRQGQAMLKHKRLTRKDKQEMPVAANLIGKNALKNLLVMTAGQHTNYQLLGFESKPTL